MATGTKAHKQLAIMYAKTHALSKAAGELGDEFLQYLYEMSMRHLESQFDNYDEILRHMAYAQE